MCEFCLQERLAEAGRKLKAAAAQAVAEKLPLVADLTGDQPMLVGIPGGFQYDLRRPPSWWANNAREAVAAGRPLIIKSGSGEETLGDAEEYIRRVAELAQS